MQAPSPRLPPPALSVLLPVRDGLAFLPEAVDSVLADALELEIDLVIVDDGSAEPSRLWLDALAARESRVRLIRTEPRGIVAALTTALAAARAPLVARMDADDRSLKGRLPALASALRADPELALVGTGVRLHPAGQAAPGMRRYVAWLNQVRSWSICHEIWIESPLVHPTIGARKALLLEAGGYAHGDFAEDYELLLRLQARGYKLAKLDAELYWWRDHGARLTRTDERYAAARHRALKVRYLKATWLSDRPRLAVWGAGRTGRPFGRALQAAGFAIGAWIDVDPRQIGRSLHGAPVRGVAELPSVADLPIVVAVGAPGARAEIRAALAARELSEGVDYVVVA